MLVAEQSADLPRKRRPTPELAGLRFGHWQVLERCRFSKHNAATWLCRCTCGRVREVRGDTLLSGRSRSCNGARHPTGGLHWRTRRAMQRRNLPQLNLTPEQ